MSEMEGESLFNDGMAVVAFSFLVVSIVCSLTRKPPH